MSIAEKLVTIAENVPKVYDAGKQAEYDRFWDEFQNYGNRTRYCGGFSGGGWNKETFKPKYVIRPGTSSTGSAYMFAFFNCNSNQLLDFREYAHMFDFSNLTNAMYMFQDAAFDHIEIDLSKCSYIGSTFSEGYFGAGKTTIKLKTSAIVKTFSDAFTACYKLSNLTFMEGSVIPVSISLSHSPLSKESITGVINALSSTATGQTATFKKSAKEAAFTADEWATLIATKPNWTISLV